MGVTERIREQFNYFKDGVKIYKPDVINGDEVESRPRRLGVLGRAAIGAGLGGLLWTGISWGEGELFPGGHNETVKVCSATMGAKLRLVKALPPQCAEDSLSAHITLIRPDATATTALEDAEPGAVYALPPKEVFVANAEEHTNYEELGWLLGAGALAGAAAPLAGPFAGRMRDRMHR